MLLLTSDLNIAETDAPSYPSETYPYQDWGNCFGPLQQYDDSLAVACQKRLETQKESERAYSEDYGVDWEYVYEQTEMWRISNLPHVLEEALLVDDRVVSARATIAAVEEDRMVINVVINASTSFSFVKSFV